MLSHLFNLQPWDYEHLTIRELGVYVANAESYIREARRASQAAR